MGINKRKRGRFDIIYDILSVLNNEPTNKTIIAYKSRLDTRMINRYIDYLINIKLVEYDNENNMLKLTDRGRAYIRLYKEMKSILG